VNKKIKSELYSVKILPDTTNNTYVRKAKLTPNMPTHLQPPPEALYIHVEISPLKLSRIWGNQYYKNVQVMLTGKEIKPHIISIFKHQNPGVFNTIITALKYSEKKDVLEPIELDVALPGKVININLGKDIYLTRFDEKGNPTKMLCARKDDEGHIISRPIITNSTRIFIFKDQLNQVESIIAKAKEQLLSYAIPVNNNI